MKRLYLLTLALGVALVSSVWTSRTADTPAARSPRAPERGPLVHMVAFKFKADAGPEKVREVERAFAALPAKIPQIRSFEWGTNISPEKLDKGFSHGFLLTFQNAADRDAYLVHPEHQAFGKLVGPVLEDVFVLDFLAKP